MGLRTVIIADFVGYNYKGAVKRDPEQDERTDETIGTDVKGDEKTSYPHVGVTGAWLTAEGEAGREIFCCGMGMGMTISANKVPDIRASMTHDSFSAERLILSNDAHILCPGQHVVGLELVKGFACGFLGYELDPLPHLKASIGVLVEYENGSAGY